MSSLKVQSLTDWSSFESLFLFLEFLPFFELFEVLRSELEIKIKSVKSAIDPGQRRSGSSRGAAQIISIVTKTIKSKCHFYTKSLFCNKNKSLYHPMIYNVTQYFAKSVICLQNFAIYLLIALDVNLAVLFAAAYQRREFMKILYCDLLPPRSRQD